MRGGPADLSSSGLAPPTGSKRRRGGFFFTREEILPSIFSGVSARKREIVSSLSTPTPPESDFRGGSSASPRRSSLLSDCRRSSRSEGRSSI